MKKIIIVLALMIATAGMAQQRKTAKKVQTTTIRKTTVPTQQRMVKKVTTTPAKQQTIYTSNSENLPIEKVAFNVSGKAIGFPEDTWVKLCKVTSKGFEPIDSVKVGKDDRFSFRGKTMNVPEMHYIVMGEGLQKTLVELFLEKGNINVEIVAEKRVDKVSGTTTNNIYTPYRNKINAIYTDMYNCIKESYNLKNSEDDRESYKLGADELRKQIVTETYNFCLKNMNNWAGLYLFYKYHTQFTYKQNSAILAKVPEKFEQIDAMARVRAFARQQAQAGK